MNATKRPWTTLDEQLPDETFCGHEKCGCKIIFYGLMSDMGGEIKFCPLHAAAPQMQAKLQAAEEMAKALHHIAWEPLGHAEANHREALDIATRIAQAALQSWEKAGK